MSDNICTHGRIIVATPAAGLTPSSNSDRPDNRRLPVTDQVFRCSDGHLFTAAWPKMVIMSLHFGIGTKWTRCPVDHRWRLVDRVNSNDLPESGLAEAK